KRSRNSISNGCVLLNEEVASQMYQQQLEIDHFVALHAEKMRSEIAEMQRRSAKRLLVAANEGIMKRLKTKEEEITRLSSNKRLLLRRKTEILLAQAQLQQQEQEQTLVNDDIDDGESGCGSNYEEHVNRKCVECGKKESCVLVLPCRHLCLCNVCDSATTICPVCSSTKSAALLINMDT
nr:hypothetical protein [Tanacetum cinerariifolium]